jgi:hypothetical protein
VAEPKAASGGRQDVAAARALFQSKTNKGQDTKKEGDELWTKHESAIVSLQPLPAARSERGATAFSTSGQLEETRGLSWELGLGG